MKKLIAVMLSATLVCLMCAGCVGVGTTSSTEHEHNFGNATCGQSATCADCGFETVLEHTTDCGICANCNKEFRKPSPVTIIGWRYEIDSAGGVEWNFQIRNNTDKQIKYVTLQWDCYNAVGDLIRDEISGKTCHGVKITGPLDAHTTSTRKRNTTKFYNYTLKSYKLTDAVIEYMDGTTETLTNYHDNVIE